MDGVIGNMDWVEGLRDELVMTGDEGGRGEQWCEAI